MKMSLCVISLFVALMVWPITRASAQEDAAQPTDAAALGIADLLPKVVATVNGKQITRDQLAAMAIGVYGRQALETLISQELVRQEAARENIALSAEEIEAHIALRVEMQLQNIAQRAGFQNVEDLAKLMEQSGRSIEDLRKEAEETFRPFAKPELLMRKLIEKTISISDEQVRYAFDIQFGPKAELLQIVLSSREEAESVLKKLEMGANFAELARTASIDPASRNNGGLVPPQPKNSPLGEPAFALEPGKISGIISLGKTFHIVKLVSLIPANDKVKFEDVKERLHQQMTEEAIANGQQQWLAQEFKEARIERHL